MHNRITGPKLPSLHKPKKYSELLPNGQDGTRRTTITVPFNGFKGFHDTNWSKKGAERRKRCNIAARWTPSMKLIFVLVSIACSCYVFLKNVYIRIRHSFLIEKGPQIKLIKGRMSPFDSHPPKFVSLNITGNTRHACLQEIRNHRHSFYLSYIKNATHILLVDPAYHSNVGDHMITIAELTLLQSQSIEATLISQCSYVQAHD